MKEPKCLSIPKKSSNEYNSYGKENISTDVTLQMIISHDLFQVHQPSLAFEGRLRSPYYLCTVGLVGFSQLIFIQAVRFNDR